MVDAADRPRGIGWLQVSDLQIGRDEAAIEAPELRALLEKDLRRLHDASGPWDFVAITGNITASGEAAEFMHAAQIVAWLWAWLRLLGSDPALILLPGPRDFDSESDGVARLHALRHAGSTRTTPMPGLVNFIGFAASLERPLHLRYGRAGLLPGDTSRIVTRAGLRAGVLGLNTTAHSRPLGFIRHDQLTAACGTRDIASWARGCDAVIVVARDAGDRLDPDSAQRLAEIEVPVVALCGPHPDGASAPICDGCRVQLPALSLAQPDSNSFGYRAGRMMMSDEQPVIRDWVRQLVSVAGAWNLEPPVASAVEPDGSTLIVFGGEPSPAAPVMLGAGGPGSRGSPTSRDLQVRHVTWSPDGHRVAAISGPGMLAIYDRDGKQVREFAAHSSTPCAVAWSPRGNQLATRSRFHIRVWAPDGALQSELYLTRPSPTAMAWLPNDTLLFGGDDGVGVWETAGGGAARALSAKPRDRLAPNVLLGRQVLALALSPLDAQVAIGTDGGIWLVPMTELLTGATTSSVLVDPTPTHALTWSLSTRMFAAGGADGLVTVWEAVRGTRIAQLEGLTDTVRSVAFSRDGRLLAATAIDGSYRVWSCRDWTPRRPSVLRRTRNLNVVAFNPTADLIALGGLAGLRIEPLSLPEEAADHDEPSDEPVVRTVSAKVVLLGEGNVGKSCLALRMTQDRYEELGSTHGMKFWSVPLDRLDPEAEIPPGERREVVFWDMGGQHEYQLLHHAFLHDTMLALMVMEPRRGEAALRELAIWDRHLTPDRSNIRRMLIGSKLDDDRVPRDPALVDRALAAHGFVGYLETSAKTGAGIAALRKAIARTIDWPSVAVTTRPQLFHRIRHYVELRRTARRVVLPYHELEDIVKQREGDDVDLGVVGAVVEQLARQGVIADARLGDGSRMLILEVEQVERYAASLILAARDNPRGVPALEMASVVSADASFPRIAPGDRLPRDQELVVLECVVDLLIKSGICFLSGRLLIFPALFRDDPSDGPSSPRRGAAVAYDFVGSIDHIYSALVCWLALDVRFGAPRLSQHRVELATPGKGTCGLRRALRPEGGAGRFEVYFDGDTDEATRELFAGVVDDFLRSHGVEMVEQLTVVCPRCDRTAAEGDVRDRIARGDRDIGCPRCDFRVPLVRTGAEAAVATPFLAAKLRAFRSDRVKTRQAAVAAARKAVAAAKKVLGERTHEPSTDRHVHVLHLSDLHISAGADLASLLQPLCSDLEDRTDGMGDHPPDLVIVSGDLTNRAAPEEFAAARGFLTQLLDHCRLTAERCIVVPGNHDLSWDAPAYRWQPRRQVSPIDPAMHVAQGDGYLVRDERGYAERFRNFSEHFFHPLFQRPYSLVPDEQAQCLLFEDLGIQVIALNSAWQIDEWFPDRSAIHLGALARTLEQANTSIADARRAGRLGHADVLRIAVWHHPITGNDKIAEDAFVESLRRARVELCLHGHVHEDRADLIGYLHPRKLRALGAGSFGAPGSARPESVPRLYNLLEIDPPRHLVRVHTRQLRRSGGAWEPWYVWPGATSAERRPYYEFLTH